MKNIVLLYVAMLSAYAAFSQALADSSRRERASQRVKSALSLSDDQAERFKQVNKDFHDGQLRLRSDTLATREQRMAQSKQLVEKRDKGMKEVLTKEQYEKWMAMRPAGIRSQAQNERQRRHMAEMRDAVGLNDQQAEEIMEINFATTENLRKTRSDSSVMREERLMAIKRAMEDRIEKIRDVLTKDQYKKFLAYEATKSKQRRRTGRSIAP